MKKRFVYLFFIIFAFLGVTAQEASATCKVPDKKPVSSQIILTKKDSKTGKGLNDAYFAIYDKNGVIKYRMRTSSSGTEATTGKAYLSGDIVPGTYTLREVQAPKGYKLNEKPQTFTISRGQTLNLTVYNDPLVTTGSLKINKVDADTGKALSGAEFSVTDSAGKVQTGVTNSSGVLELANLAAGAATIKETKAPNGYVLTNNIPSVTINVDQQSSVTVKNQKEILHGSLKITKVDASSGALLAGAVFSVTDSAGKTQTGTTNSAGVLELSNLAVGTATIKETKAPNGYVSTNNIPAVTINGNKQTTTTVKNQKEILSGSLKITKIDADSGAALAGAEFSVTDSAGKTQTGVTNAAGILEFSNLATGTATIKETKAPNNYVLDSQEVKTTINNKTQSAVTIKNRKQVKLLEIKAVDTQGRPVVGAEFLVRLNGAAIAVGKTEADGSYAVGVNPGEGNVIQLAAPSGYTLLSDKLVSYTITSKDSIKTITFTYRKGGI